MDTPRESRESFLDRVNEAQKRTRVRLKRLGCGFGGALAFLAAPLVGAETERFYYWLNTGVFLSTTAGIICAIIVVVAGILEVACACNRDIYRDFT